MTPTFSFFRRYVMPYTWWFAAGTLCLLLTNWLSVQIPLQLATAIDALRAGQRHGPVIQSAIIAIALMGLGVMMVRTLSRVLFFTPGRQIEFALKNDVFANLLRQQPSFYATWETGDIISRASEDMTFVRVYIGFGSLSVVNTGLALLLTGTQMFLLSGTLTLLVLLPIIVSLGIVQFGIYRLFDKMKQSSEQLSEISEHVLSSIHGMQTIQGFRAEDAFTRRFMERNQAYTRINLEVSQIRSWVLPVLGVGGSLCIYVLLAVGGPMAIRKEISVGELVAFTTYVAYLLQPLRSLGWIISVFQRGQASLERVLVLLQAPPECPEGEHPVGIPKDLPLHLSIRNLTFAYPDEPDKPVLRHIHATFPAGSWIGVFGRTGSGKSTLLRILARLYNPPPNTVFANDIDITSVDLQAWRRELAMVPQTPFLFSDTVRANVAMSDKQTSEEALRRVLQQAALEQDIKAFPNDLDTVVGERGIMVSGGQRQRITLARALFRQYRVLLLDDVLSAVDHRTEKQLIQTLQDVATSSVDGVRPTVILVSHRLSALAHCDNILVLEQGELVHSGTHEELLRCPGPYREAWQHQAESVVDEQNLPQAQDKADGWK